MARKSRSVVETIDYCGGFKIIDPAANRIVAGERVDLSTADQIG